jgi:hypothetical protein
MPLIHIPVGVAPCQVDDFPQDAERSCKGALHFRPASTKEITADELAHLRAAPQHKKLAARLCVVDVVVKAAPSQSVATPTPTPTPMPPAPMPVDPMSAGDS